MNEEKLGILYNKIVNIVIGTIPEEWSKVFLYSEVVDGSQTAFFYYYPKKNQTPVYSHDITEIFSVHEQEYRNKWHNLLDAIQELKDEFRVNKQTPWTNFTLFLDNTGTFKINFNYDDLSSANPHERKTIWKYKYLGITPKSNSGKIFLKNYLESTKNRNS